MTVSQFQILIDLYHKGELSPLQWAELKNVLQSELFREQLTNEMAVTFDEMQRHSLWTEDLKAQTHEHILTAVRGSGNEDVSQSGVPTTRVRKLSWFKYAAAIIIILGIGAYLWNMQQKEKPLITTTKPVPVKNDIPAGGNKATLTLSDGRVFDLNDLQKGEFAQDKGMVARKTAEGQIVYEKAGHDVGPAMVWNTMTTPKGGQYQLTLEDGTKVWLNAASSITYPTVFNGKQRNVNITGEAYFEVSKNPSKPFVVKTPREEITVLGTSFNVNAYADEEAMKTSLLEGAVKINETTLLPGQAYVKGKIVATNTAQDIAWKNGIFNFDDADLPTVLRQLSRWYDIDIRYEGKGSTEVFRGKLSKQLPLSEILKILRDFKVRFRIEDKTLIIQ